MSKLPSLTGKAMLRALRKAGFEEIRIKDITRLLNHALLNLLLAPHALCAAARPITPPFELCHFRDRLNSFFDCDSDYESEYEKV